MPFDFLYKGLNAEQRAAVGHFYGPSLILAGAGSGKTRVIVHRIAALILERRVQPEHILAVTFTNKAAREMRERSLTLLRSAGLERFSRPWIGTFHSIAAQLLRSNLRLLPERRSFTIYDSAEQLQLMKQTLKDLNIDESLHPAKGFRDSVNLCKRSGRGPHELHHIPHLADDRRFHQVYEAYEKALKKAGAFDFESLIFECCLLMRKNQGFLQSLREKFKFIFVDEYQDTNRIQYLMIKALAGESQNVCVVGDEDQSIYGWRGADISHILNFEKDFSPCKTFFLERNYRSTRRIVSLAASLISCNILRKGKKLWTENSEGSKALVRETLNAIEESRFISQKIQALCESGEHSYKDFCVLYRANAQSRALEDGFRLIGAPYKIVGGLRFYERQEIKDALSYLKLISNPHDDIAFLRALKTPKRGLGAAAVKKLQSFAGHGHAGLFAASKEALKRGAFKGKAYESLKRFVVVLEGLKARSASLSLYDLYILAIEKTGLLEHFQKDRSAEGQSHVENLNELANVIEQKSRAGPISLSSFLEEVSLLSESDKTKGAGDAVTLMTLHNSKGLEFPQVFISGLEEGLFPSAKSIESGDLEEERRLAYVGVTRAKVSLTLTFARRRSVWGMERSNEPSRFLKELSEKDIHFQGLFFDGEPDADDFSLNSF